MDEEEILDDDDEESSWLEIIFYVFVSILILKGILFTGLYIMKKMGGYYIQLIILEIFMFIKIE